MKHSKDMINEGLSKDTIDELMKIINDPNTSEKIGRAMLNRGRYSGKMGFPTGEKSPGVRTLTKNGTPSKRGWIEKPTDLFEDDPYGVYNKLSNISIESNKIKQVVDILINNDQMENYINYLNDKELWIYGSDIIKGNNVFNILKKTGIDFNTLKELSDLTDSKKNVSQGKFEILIKMFLKDLNPGNLQGESVGRGDFYANNKAFEIKGDLARTGSATHNARPIMNCLNNLIKQYNPNIKFNKDPFSSVANINESIPIILQNPPDKETAFDIIFESMCAQFSEFSAPKITKSEKLKLLDDIFIKTKNKGAEGYSNIKKLMTAIQLYFYQIEEGFDYFMLISNNTGDYMIVPKEKFSIMNLYNLPHMKISGGKGGNSNDKRDEYCQISYQK